MKVEPVSKILPLSPRATAPTVEETDVWETLVPRLLHPIKLLIVEMLLWVEEPMSATGLAAMLDDPSYYGGLLSYHLAEMAKAGVLTVVEARAVRGAEELLFYFPQAQESGDRPVVAEATGRA